MTDKQDKIAGATEAGVAAKDGTGLGETAADVTAIDTGADVPLIAPVEGAEVPLIAPVEGAVDLNAEGLATIAAKLAGLGLAPDGDFDIAEATCAVLGDLSERVTKAETELAAETAALTQALAAAEKAARAASASAGRASGKARKISAKDVVDPIEASGEGDEAITREQALLLAIGEAETVEVVLSNGKTELIAVPPIAIHGDAWRISMVGVQLTLPELIVHGPAPGQSGYALNGYGLLLDGVLRAYMARGEQLNIAGGSNNNIGPDIVF